MRPFPRPLRGRYEQAWRAWANPLEPVISDVLPFLRVLRKKTILRVKGEHRQMNETRTTVRYVKPPRFLPTLFNPIAKTILRSPLHGLLSRQLLLMTFTGRKSGNSFTTPAMYEQEGDMLRLHVGYPWWKNLRGGATVHVCLRGKGHIATTEVVGEEGGLIVVEVHLKS